MKKKNSTSPSSVSVRKSQRLEQVTPPKAKKKIEMESPLRRSERENKFQSRKVKTSPEKGLWSKGGGGSKGQNTPDKKGGNGKEKEKEKEIGDDVKGNFEVGSKRKTRLDARHFRKMFKPLKKKVKLSDSDKKRPENKDDSGDSGTENVVEGQQEHSDGEDLKKDSSKAIDANEGISEDEKKKTERIEADCATVEKNMNVLRNRKEITFGFPSSSSGCKTKFLIEPCNKCFRKKRLDYNSPPEGLCCCFLNSKNDVDVISITTDRVERGTFASSQFAQKHDEDTHLCDSSRNAQCSRYAACRREGKLLHCGGKGCRRSYHSSCLLTPKVDVLLPIWYCSQCNKKRLNLGVHSVSEGIESIWGIRDVQLSNSEGVVKQKQCFVKYKGLAHLHNQWVPEMQLLHEASELLANFSEKKEGQWKPVWAVPHRLLLKRFVDFDDHPAEQNDEDAVTAPNGHCEWLVKWGGLDYDQASWELEDALFFKTPDIQRLVREYEARHDRTRKASLSKSNENQEKRKGSHIKLGRLTAGGLSGADSCFLNSLNKLREYHNRGHNAILLEEQDSVLKVIWLISSLVTITNRPFLIITSYAFLTQWEAEFLRVDTSINVVTYHGSTDARELARTLEFYEGGNMMLQVVVSSIEVLLEDFEKFKGIEWEAVIVDDYPKSCCGADTIAIKDLATCWRVLLLHAQLKDDVAEYINILSFLESGGISNKNPQLTINAHESIDVLKERLSSFIVCARFLEFWVPVQISNVQLEQYCSLILSNSAALRSFSKSDPVGSLRDTLISALKCCDHPYIVDPSLQTSLSCSHPSNALLDLGTRASGKLLLLDKILSGLRDKKLKVLILYQSIGGLGRDNKGDILEDFLGIRFGADSYEHVDGGGCISSKKQAALTRFNGERERSFFLLETRACFPSIKLLSVDAVILFDSDCNPVNDMRALHKITIDSKLKQIKVFRLYCSYTVEEKVLILAKNDMILDNGLQGISGSTIHTLLMWGASYLFSKLDEFHRVALLDNGDTLVPQNSFLKDVCEEIMLLFQDHEAMDSRTYISVARQSGGSYRKNTFLLGEHKNQLEDGGPPHVFWMKLLDGKQPQWKYLSGSSQRNRKRVSYLDDCLVPSEVQPDEAAKKRKKVDSTKAADKDCGEKSGMAKVISNEYLKKGNDQPSSIVPKAPDLTNEQKELFELSKPTVLRLCEILLLKDDGKIWAEQFLEYIFRRHRVTREPETILQAFEISVCWKIADLLNQKIDHAKSLALAREKMNFSCTEDDADYMYSKLKLLDKMFKLRSDGFKVPSASEIPLAINGITTDLKENGMGPKESLLHNCSDKQVVESVQTANNENDSLGHIKKVRKKCYKLMERLKKKQKEESEQFKKNCEEERAELEKKYIMESAVIRSIHNKSSVGVDKLKVLDSDYAEKRRHLERQLSTHLKELEARHQAERDEQRIKTAKWLEQIKSLVEEGQLDKLASESRPVIAAEHNEPCKHLEGINTTGKHQQQNSDSKTPGTVALETVPLVAEFSVNPENMVTSELRSPESDEQTLVCQDDATINSLRAVPPKEVGSSNLNVGSLQEQSHATTRELEGDTNQISVANQTVPASSASLPVSQELGNVSCQRWADGAEVLLQPITEPLPVITPHDSHRTNDASSSRLENERTEVRSSTQDTLGLIQQENNIANTSTEAGSQRALASGVDHVIDANLVRCETHPLTRDAFIHATHPNPVPVPTYAIARSPSMSSDPLQNEWERIRREIDEIVNTHEERKLRLISERDKEVEEIVAEIHKKYEGKMKESDASFSIKRNELQMIQEKVMMHKFLADAFKSKCTDTKAATGIQVLPSGPTEQISQLPATRPISIPGLSSSLTHKPTPPMQNVHPSVVAVSHATPRPPQMNPPFSTSTAIPQQVRVAAHVAAPQPFRSASLHISSSSMPSVSSSILGQQPPGNTPASSAASVRPPHLPQFPPQTFPQNHTHQGEITGGYPALNLSLSATELLMEIRRQSEIFSNNLPPLPDNVRNSESWDISEFGTAANVQLPSSTSGAGDDVVCLSDDD